MRLKTPSIILFLSVCLISISQTQAQPNVTDNQKLRWYSIEEAEALNKTAPKKFMIDMYTDWCGWCKKMDESTFSHPEIIALLNQSFYAVKINAETKDTITFNNNKYISLSKAGRATHPLAVSLLGWRMSYPTIVYFTEKLEYLGPMPGYKTAEQLEVILNFIAQEKFRTMGMEEFEKSFVSKIKPKAPSIP